MKKIMGFMVMGIPFYIFFGYIIIHEGIRFFLSYICLLAITLLVIVVSVLLGFFIMDD